MMVAWPAPLMPLTWFSTNGPLGTLAAYCCTPLTYRLSEDGTSAVPSTEATGKVSKSGRSWKFLRH